MYEEACGYGLKSGLTLPFHGAKGELGILCFVNDATPGEKFRKEAVRSMADLTLLRDFAFEASLAFAVKAVEQKTVTLTKRELECLKWCAAGKSSWEIARILHRSEAVVNFHFSNIRRKLDTTTRRQSVVKAIRLGLISPL
jgi:LuxR family quorum-sensing transcriptional regulator LasR